MPREVLPPDNIRAASVDGSELDLKCAQPALRKLHNATCEETQVRENPFRYGPAALGPHFTDRVTELETLVRDLRSRQHVVIISPRRFGKTSLALTARSRLVHGKVLVAYADLFRATTKHRLLEELGLGPK